MSNLEQNSVHIDNDIVICLLLLRFLRFCSAKDPYIEMGLAPTLVRSYNGLRAKLQRTN